MAGEGPRLQSIHNFHALAWIVSGPKNPPISSLRPFYAGSLAPARVSQAGRVGPHWKRQGPNTTLVDCPRLLERFLIGENNAMIL